MRLIGKLTALSPPFYRVGSGSQPQPPDPAEDMLSAIIASFQANARLAADLGGRVYLGKGGASTTYPYAIMEDQSTMELITSTSETSRTRLKFTVFSKDADSAGEIGDDIERCLKDQGLEWSTGWASKLRPDQRKQQATPQKGQNGADVFAMKIGFECRTRRNLS